jgi:hypothetical protein
MTTGWPQNQQDLRWPHSDSGETGPDGRTDGRVATDTDRSDAAGGFGTAHPSGPLPVMPAPQRGRFGRGRSRDTAETDDGAGGDADYDWIRYLGEAGPAQEHAKRPADRPATDSERERGSRTPGRKFARRSGAADQPAAETPATSFPAAGQAERQAPARQADEWPARDYPVPSRWTDRRGADRPEPGGAPRRPGPDQAAADGTAVMPQAPAERRPLARPSRPSRPQPGAAQPESWETGIRQPESRWPGAGRPGSAPEAAAGTAWPATTSHPWPAQDRPQPRPASPEPADFWSSPADEGRSTRGYSTRDYSRQQDTGIGSPPHSGHAERHRRSRHQPDQASLASLAAAGRAAAESVPDVELDTPRPAGRAASRAARRAETAALTTTPDNRTRSRRGAPVPDAAASVATPDRTRRFGGRKDKDNKAAAAAGTGSAEAPGAAIAPGSATDATAAFSAAPVIAPERRPDAGTAPVTQAPVSAPVTQAPVSAPSRRAGVSAAPAEAVTARTAAAARPRTADAARKTRKRGRVRHPVRLAVGGGVVAAVAVAGVVVLHPFGGSSAPTHSISLPPRLQAYAQNPALASGLGAQALRTEIVRKGNGEASHVVDAVYEDSTGPAAKAGPLIILFVGGNLSGSASSFISSFTGLLPSAFVTGPGSLGGQAACVPGTGGHPAECAWADNDTFGLIASPTLSAAALGRELRSMRPLVEHVVRR